MLSVLDEWGSSLETVSFADLSVLLVEHLHVTASASVFAKCAENNVAVIFCDGKHQPVSLTQPFHGHTLHTKVFRELLAVKHPRLKSLWKQIIRGKVLNQAALLGKAGIPGAGLVSLAGKIRSGDPGNIEARAARIYWQRLLGKGFIRDREGSWPNPLLNYGYSVLRAAVAKAVVSTGMHPAFPVHHHNQYNPFCLADDLMEPYRPFVDWKAFEIYQYQPEGLLGLEQKHKMLGLLVERYPTGGKSLPLFQSLSSFANQAMDWLRGSETKVQPPIFK